MPGEPLTATPTGERRCLCVADHTPEPRELHRHHVWPLGEGGPDVAANLKWLCPSSHSNTHKLWREYESHGGKPPWTILGQYGKYVRDLVADGWAQAHPQESQLAERIHAPANPARDQEHGRDHHRVSDEDPLTHTEQRADEAS